MNKPQPCPQGVHSPVGEKDIYISNDNRMINAHGIKDRGLSASTETSQDLGEAKKGPKSKDWI